MRAKRAEADEMIAYMEWRNHQPHLIHHIWHTPNGGSRNKAEAANLKRQGVMSGVADITVNYPMAQWYGLFIEMKRPDKTNPPTKNQIEFLARQFIKGYAVTIQYCAMDAIRLTQKYMHGDYDPSTDINNDAVIERINELLA